LSAATSRIRRDRRPADWKRVDEIQDALSERDRGIAEKAGGVITEEEYRKDYWRGLD